MWQVTGRHGEDRSSGTLKLLTKDDQSEVSLVGIIITLLARADLRMCETFNWDTGQNQARARQHSSVKKYVCMYLKAYSGRVFPRAVVKLINKQQQN